MSSLLNKGSETAFDFHCDLCYKDKKYVEAVGYCSDCKDYLCQECYNYHLKPKPMHHHVLLDQHRMPKAVPKRQNKDMCTEPCAEHNNETLKYFCVDHKRFGCRICMTLHYQKCKCVDYIPDIAGDILTSKEYKNIKFRVKCILETAESAINKTKQKIHKSNQQHSKVSDFFKKLKKDFIDAVDKLETLTITDSEKIRDGNQKKLKYAEDWYNKLLKYTGSLDSNFTNMENQGQYSQIYFYMKRSQEKLASLEASIQQLKDQSRITEYEVNISDDLLNLIQCPENMASLETIKYQWTPPTQTVEDYSSKPLKSVPDNTKVKPSAKPQSNAANTTTRINKKPGAVHVTDIGMSIKEDRDFTCITGSVLLSGDKLVIVDGANDAVKMIAMKSNKLSDLKYQKELWDITAVSNTQVAVTSPPDSKILFINVTNILKLDHKVNVEGECRGIACFGDKLAVINGNPVKVKIINQKGELLHTIITGDRGRQLFPWPLYMAVSPDQQTLYISDWYRKNVTSMDISGQVKATYKDEKLSSPRGLTVNRAGVLFVCGYRSNNIHQLTPDLHKIQVLLQQSDGIMTPNVVTYSDEQNTLFVGCNNVKVYRLQ